MKTPVIHGARVLALAWLLALAGPVRAADAVEDLDVDNVVIVLDASGSMKEQMPDSSESKMALAKKALSEVVAQSSEGTHVGLLVFSGGGYGSNEWVMRLGPQDLGELERNLVRIEPRGKTPLGRYIKKGADRLLEARAAQHGYGSFRLLIVTDGEATDPALVEQYLPDVLSRGIVVDVISVAMDKAHDLANRVHSYRSANDPKALTRALTEVFAEVGRGRTDDPAGADAFALVNGLPDGMALPLIEALAESGNQPIGERLRR